MMSPTSAYTGPTEPLRPFFRSLATPGFTAAQAVSKRNVRAWLRTFSLIRLRCGQRRCNRILSLELLKLLSCIANPFQT